MSRPDDSETVSNAVQVRTSTTCRGTHDEPTTDTRFRCNIVTRNATADVVVPNSRSKSLYTVGGRSARAIGNANTPFPCSESPRRFRLGTRAIVSSARTLIIRRVSVLYRTRTARKRLDHLRAVVAMKRLFHMYICMNLPVVYLWVRPTASTAADTGKTCPRNYVARSFFPNTISLIVIICYIISRPRRVVQCSQTYVAIRNIICFHVFCNAVGFQNAVAIINRQNRQIKLSSKYTHAHQLGLVSYEFYTRSIPRDLCIIQSPIR